MGGNHRCPAACRGEPPKNNSIDQKTPMLERMDKRRLWGYRALGYEIESLHGRGRQANEENGLEESIDEMIKLPREIDHEN
jgi:hypothetical protein